MKILRLKNHLQANKAEQLKGSFLDHTHYDTLITTDCDAYDLYGNLLLRYRKNALPYNVLKQGYTAFKDSIELTEGRGIASGSSHKRVRKDGSVSNITIGNKVYSGNVGYMDAGAMIHYCRKTAFSRKYFDKYEAGIPFVKHIDKKYEELCPNHYAKQLKMAQATNGNYRISNTSFTTVTVNRNFQTAVHKDSGDLPDGFGNLIVYREGNYEGAYFCLPEYRIAIDMENCDILFTDVHKWHGNTPFVNCDTDYQRMAFVLYYREYMYKCQQPTKELESIKINKTGYLTL